jgi:alpha-ketoglutaric semialdehyde dehydrogenase
LTKLLIKLVPLLKNINWLGRKKRLFFRTDCRKKIKPGNELIQGAMLKSGLPEARLTGERNRTTGQLKLFADVLREVSWLQAVIETALPEYKSLAKADVRKKLIPIGQTD